MKPIVLYICALFPLNPSFYNSTLTLCSLPSSLIVPVTKVGSMLGKANAMFVLPGWPESKMKAEHAIADFHPNSPQVGVLPSNQSLIFSVSTENEFSLRLLPLCQVWLTLPSGSKTAWG